MAKTCNHNGCNYPVFSNGYCKIHQHMRTDEKYQKSILKRNKPFKNQKGVITPKSSIKKKFPKATGELKLFKRMWDIMVQVEGIPRCEVTNVEITEFSPYNFHHLLTKGAYPELRLETDNIIFIHSDVHDNIHSTVPLSQLIKNDVRYKTIQDRIDYVKQRNN